MLNRPFPDEHKVPVLATIIATIFLPGFLLGVVSCWHKNMLKTIFAHPSIVLMPAFTHFTFKSNTKWCKGRMEENEEENEKSTDPFITFSPKFTLANVIISIIGNIVYAISMTHIAGWDELHEGLPVYLSLYLLPYILMPILGFLLTLSCLLFTPNSSGIHSAVKYILGNLVFNAAAFLVFSVILRVSNGRAYYTAHQRLCFLLIPILGLLVTVLKIILARYCNINLPACFSLPKVEYGALVCSNLQAHYVLDSDGKPELIPEYEEDEVVNNQRNVLEMSADTSERVASQEEDEIVEVVLDQAEDEPLEAEIQAV